MQINPTEIENVIQSIEGVELVSVVPIPNVETINLTCAAIIKRKGFESLTEQNVMDHVASNLPTNKHLHGGVIFVDKFPTTPSGKVMRRLVQEYVVEIINQNQV